jgi:RimJ/RimL family protein N-acetyltransferase
MIELSSERLLLRGWLAADREPFAALNADPIVMRHFMQRLSRTESDELIDEIQEEFTREGWGLWALEERSTGVFLGFTGLSRPPFEAHFTPNVEIGWRLARHAWGRGLATEAARTALAFGFNEVRLKEIVSFTAVGNERSRAVMRRLGMSYDPSDDFDHPDAPEGHELRRHVLYRLRGHPDG